VTEQTTERKKDKQFARIIAECLLSLCFICSPYHVLAEGQQPME